MLILSYTAKSRWRSIYVPSIDRYELSARYINYQLSIDVNPTVSNLHIFCKYIFFIIFETSAYYKSNIYTGLLQINSHPVALDLIKIHNL